MFLRKQHQSFAIKNRSCDCHLLREYTEVRVDHNAHRLSDSRENKIEVLVDVRSVPYSQYSPEFNAQTLSLVVEYA